MLFRSMLINLILSGDNAVVIALACRALPPKQRFIGIVLGAVVAIVMRIVFTVVAAQLLTVPWLMTIGSVLLFWIAIKLLVEDGEEKDIKESSNVWGAVQTIAIADLVDAGAAGFVRKADEVRIGKAVFQLRDVWPLAVREVEDGYWLDRPWLAGFVVGFQQRIVARGRRDFRVQLGVDVERPQRAIGTRVALVPFVLDQMPHQPAKTGHQQAKFTRADTIANKLEMRLPLRRCKPLGLCHGAVCRQGSSSLAATLADGAASGLTWSVGPQVFTLV